MFADWKLLALAAIGIVTFLWLGSRNDSGEAMPASEIAMNGRAAGCVEHRASRCTVDIGYAYPAGDLLVLPEDAYF